MVPGGLFRILASAAALSLSTGLVAASPLKNDGAVAQVTEPAAPYAIFHRTEDPRSVAMRDALEGAVSERLIHKSDIEAVTAFYEGQDFAMAWIEDGKLSDEAMAILVRIKAADTDGLNPADYRLPRRAFGKYAPASLADQVATDLMLSQAIADYTRHIYSGRLTPTSISSNFGYEGHDLEAADILGLVSASTDPVATLEAYQPPHEEYHTLRAQLAKERNSTEVDTKPEISGGALIKAGMSDPRVTVIREWLEIDTEVEDATLYDEEVVEAVKTFQKSVQLRADGIVGKNTVAAMNRGEADHIEMIVANMERWRWMPRYLGDFYVRVNIPNYNVEIYKDEAVVHSTPIIVGKVRNQTPIFSDEIEHVVVNPVWNVPASIARNEMLPRLRSGSSLGGYKVYANIRGKFRAVNPRSINWRNVNMSKIQIKQPPGSRNALGRVKYLFPNKYAVYLHDTPSKSLFGREMRALSHGCMRVKDPFDFGEALLAYNDEIDGSKLEKMVGGGERWMNLKKTIPVHITYFTAWVDDSGDFQVRNDIYGHDKRIMEALERAESGGA